MSSSCGSSLIVGRRQRRDRDLARCSMLSMSRRLVLELWHLDRRQHDWLRCQWFYGRHVIGVHDGGASARRSRISQRRRHVSGVTPQAAARRAGIAAASAVAASRARAARLARGPIHHHRRNHGAQRDSCSRPQSITNRRGAGARSRSRTRAITRRVNAQLGSRATISRAAVSIARRARVRSCLLTHALSTAIARRGRDHETWRRECSARQRVHPA